MPYRALTHNRVHMKGGTTRFETPSGTATQSSAVNSSKGIANSGSVISQRNKQNTNNAQPRRFYTRTLSTNFLMKADAFGPATNYLKCKGGKSGCGGRIGEGKGFPNAMPQTSVGSTNVFARRAIARRSVTWNPDTVKDGCVAFDSSSKSY